jgi:hypothetical protein
MPLLYTALPKPVTIAVSQRPDVPQVYDISKQAKPAVELSPMDRAI